MEIESSLDVTGGSGMVVNAYGSAIAADEDFENLDTAEDEDEAIHCNCNGVCSRKKGRGLCVCKASNKYCRERCRCNLQNCRNKPTGESNVRRGTPSTQPAREIYADGEVRFQHDLQTSLTEIQAFVSSLDASQKDQILIDLLCMGRGSLDFAKNLVGSAANPPSPPGPAAPQWCTCGRCRPMETDVENVCCKRVNCVTRLNRFSNICLDRDILEVCIKSRCDFRSDEFDFTMESFRKAGYRQYIMWKFGKLGRGNRRVVPSCVVWAIRDSFPSANGQYMGFRVS